MSANSKRPRRYDLKAADRRRGLLIGTGLTALVVIFAVALALYIVFSNHGNDKAIRVTSSKLITKPGTNEPKAVLSLYEDFLCPVCGQFEKLDGSTVNNLIDTGAAAADYHMVAILDSAQTQHYSSRAAAAAYCVVDQSTDAFRRFHAALYAQQPSEAGSSFPDNAALIETARQAGAGGDVADCINSGKYLDVVKGIAKAAKITATPTIRINGQDYQWTAGAKPKPPDDLINQIKAIVGDVPGLVAGTPAPTAPGPS